LGHMLAEVRTRKKAQREAQLRDVRVRQQQTALNELADRSARKHSHRQAQAVRQAKVVKLEKAREIERNMRAAELARQLAVDNPDLSPAQIRALVEQRFPRT